MTQLASVPFFSSWHTALHTYHGLVIGLRLNAWNAGLGARGYDAAIKSPAKIEVRITRCLGGSVSLCIVRTPQAKGPLPKSA